MASGYRVDRLNIGVSEIHRWRHEDEVHLPEKTFNNTPFLPHVRPLDQILRRETLDERLSGYVIPADIDADLLQPAVMTATRKAMQERFARARSRVPLRHRALMEAAASLLEEEMAMDGEIQEALAALLRG